MLAGRLNSVFVVRAPPSGGRPAVGGCAGGQASGRSHASSGAPWSPRSWATATTSTGQWPGAAHRAHQHGRAERRGRRHRPRGHRVGAPRGARCAELRCTIPSPPWPPITTRHSAGESSLAPDRAAQRGLRRWGARVLAAAQRSPPSGRRASVATIAQPDRSERCPATRRASSDASQISPGFDLVVDTGGTYLVERYDIGPRVFELRMASSTWRSRRVLHAVARAVPHPP